MGLCQAMVGSGAARRERPVRPRLLLQEALLTLSTPFHQYPLVFCEERSLTVAVLLGAGCVGAGAHATRGIPLKQRPVRRGAQCVHGDLRGGRGIRSLARVCRYVTNWELRRCGSSLGVV